MAGSLHCDEECINHGRYCAFDSIIDAYKDRFKPRQVSSLQCCMSYKRVSTKQHNDSSLHGPSRVK